MGKIILFLVVLCFAWYVLSAVEIPAAALLVVALAGPLGLLLTGWLGRRALDRQPGADNAARITLAVHQAVIVLLGSGAIAATRFFRDQPLWKLPLPEELGLVLFTFSTLLLLASTANLILSGLGIPVAYLQTRQLASDWLYSWTRNPIVLSALLVMFSLGLWMNSAGLVGWTVILLAPAAFAMLVLFEERELEIRFGAQYLDYKAHVPMLFPRIPRS
jgi:protein-S-isoprenylcysteine O-methyltransferase Ste14